jgi:hypothetical protein
VWYADKYNVGGSDELEIKHSIPSSTDIEPDPCEDWVGVDFTVEAQVTAVVPSCWDPGWNTHAHYVQENNKILVANQERYRTAGTDKRASYAGLTIWDVRDPANPVYLARHEFPKGPISGGRHLQAGGVHHFYFDGRYVYGGTEYQGFLDRIFFIVDLKKPDKPETVGTWHVTGQALSGEYRSWTHQGSFFAPVYYDASKKLVKKVGLHYTFVQGNRAYLSYHHEGVIILDITKKDAPKFVGQLDYIKPLYVPAGTDPNDEYTDRPLRADGELDVSPDDDACAAESPAKATNGIACGNAHAAKLVPGRNLLVVSDEYFACPYGHVRIVDIKDEKNPKVISHFWYPEQINCERDWGPAIATTPSAHLGFAQNSNLYWMAWYGYSLRGIDISDPENPKEAAHFFYSILDGTSPSVTYDVAKGPHGLLYVTDNVSGIRVLKYKGVEAPEETGGDPTP